MGRAVATGVVSGLVHVPVWGGAASRQVRASSGARLSTVDTAGVQWGIDLTNAAERSQAFRLLAAVKRAVHAEARRMLGA